MSIVEGHYDRTHELLCKKTFSSKYNQQGEKRGLARFSFSLLWYIYVLMNEKLLWKIEELWNKNFCTEKLSSNGTRDTISQILHKRFFASGLSFSFISNKKFSFEESANFVFSDEYGCYKGFRYNQVTTKGDQLFYLFDNHNKFLVPLYHLYQILERPIKILHIDAHEDNALYQYERPEQFDEEVLIELLEKTRISDFYDSLSNTQVISEITRITHSQDFENLPYGEYDILSLDIDIFGPEGNFAELEKKIAVIAAAMPQSSIITIATSPGFIDQNFAVRIVKIFIKHC